MSPPTDRAAGPTGGDPAISVRGLWKVFGSRADRVVGSTDALLSRADLRTKTGCLAAVRNVSFDVRPGEIFVVMGLSGSGKSTLARCLIRLVEPTSGEVHIDGDAVHTMNGRRLRDLRRHRVTMVFQHFGLLPHRRVIDNVAYGLEIQGIGRPARHRRAGEVLDLVGLDGYEACFPHELSGGMQQRVGLARALATDPAVMLFDEPFSALDPLIRRDMQAELHRLHREVGKTTVFITHDLSEALKLGDRIAVMRDGELVQVGLPQDLVGAPADRYVADFVRDVPRADVLTVRWIARQPDPDEPVDGPAIPADTVIRDAVTLAVHAGAPLRVVDGGAVIGVIDRDQVLRVVTGEPAGAGGPCRITVPTAAGDRAGAARPPEAGEPARATQPPEASEPARATQPPEASEPARAAEPTGAAARVAV